MSDANLERITILLQARDRDFARAMDRNNKLMARLNREGSRNIRQMSRTVNTQLDEMARRAQSFAVNFARGLAVGAVTTGLALVTRSIRGAVSTLSDLGKRARDVGLDVEELQGLMRGFARATRISEDEASSAFERFNRRIGEAVNGAGPLNTTIERYGISLRRSNGEMRTQAELLREVATAIRNARTEQERAAIAQAAFGDVGRRMASALAAGPEALDEMIAQARNAGDIIDRNLIQRAELLDDRFDALTRRVRTFFQELAVGAFGGGVETPLETLIRLFGSLERAQEALGPDLLEALTRDTDGVERHAQAVDDVAGSYEEWSDSLHQIIRQLDTTAQELDDLGAHDAAQGMREVADRINDAGIALRDGEINAADFQRELTEGQAAAQALTAQVQALDSETLSGLRGSFAALIAQVTEGIRAVNALRAAASLEEIGPSADPFAPVGSGGRAASIIRDRQAALFLAEEERRAARTREQIALERELESVQARARAAGVELTDAQAQAQARLNLELRQGADGGGGGSRGGGRGRGSSGPDDFERAVQAIQERTAALEAEAVALGIAASTNRSYGEAVAWAGEYARLLAAAQRQGLQITPELEEQIKALADAYVDAAEGARQLADGMVDVHDRAEAGANALADIFMAATQGSDQARQAVARLAAQIAQMLAIRGIEALLGGFSGGRGRVAGAAASRAGGGGVQSGQPYRVNENTANSEIFVPSRSGGILNVAQAKDALRGGGVVRVVVEEGPMFAARVRAESTDVAVEVVQAGLAEFNRQLPGRVQQISNDPRRTR